MNNLFVPYDIAVKLKEKGFNESCLGYYYPEAPRELYHAKLDTIVSPIFLNDTDYVVDAPLYQQVIDWFRENHNTHIEIRVTKTWDADHWLCYVLRIQPKVIGDNGIKQEYDSVYDYTLNKMTYYQALDKGIEEALKFIQ